ncbi:MAG TPA: 4Fe-4S dicluster domain-containing protein [Kofleriaceae bacterium]|nr:4Fe-4S dicluster domain-containing protein [Kofleriaceae bacterium]
MNDRNRDTLNRALAGDSGGLSRREALRLLGASAGLAGLGACQQPPSKKILPYVNRPADVTPGMPDYYATSMVLDGFATGLLIESHQGRPTKVEGNPEHPASLGKAGVLEQASVLGVYDPDRATQISHRQVVSSWPAFVREVARHGPSQGLRFVLPPQSSPVLADLVDAIAGHHPGARFVYHSPVSRKEAYRATQAIYGTPLEVQRDFSRAKVVVSFEADFLATMPFSVRAAHDYGKRRHLAAPDGDMGRLYVVETVPSATGSVADNRLRSRSRDIWRIAAQVVSALLAQQAQGLPPALARQITAAAGSVGPWAQAVARDLLRYPGESIVVAGDAQPAATHLLAQVANHILGNVGKSVWLTAPAILDPLGDHDLAGLVSEIHAGAVDRLIILEGNPVYTAPADLEFERALARVRQTAHVSLFDNETSAACKWLVPAKHYLESWGDARAYDGTISFVQPLLRPLYAARSVIEVLGLFSGRAVISDHELVESYWQSRRPIGASFRSWWQTHLQRGVVPDTAAPRATAQATWAQAGAILASAPADGDSLEIRFPVSPAVYDGRFANNVWLQELPGTVTRLSWGNALLVSPATAKAMRVSDTDVVTVERAGRRVRAPILEIPGHADGVVSLYLGYGRRGSERAARGVGTNAYLLRTTDADSFARDVTVTRTGEHHDLALAQLHWDLHDRPIAFSTTAAIYRANPDFTERARGPAPSLLPNYGRSGNQWAMTIDTGICTGCSACVIACQAENNIMVVGRKGVMGGREMQWLRIDRYYKDPSKPDPEVIHQPMLCQHCENAPCEYVCPVNATVHSPDGLNEMVYNRCVGTRFCSNNCPYKVRRFNWFEYADPSIRKLQRNPDVTVRDRGVMEKCTYCVQRIRRAEIAANLGHRDLRPGEVQTACQQTCPTGAIQFGSLSHPDTDMVRWRQQPRQYDCLHEVGTRPRTQYLAKITNPNPEIK